MIKFILLWYLKRNIRIMEHKLKELDLQILECQDIPQLSAKADEFRKRFLLLKSELDIHKAKVITMQNSKNQEVRDEI